MATLPESAEYSLYQGSPLTYVTETYLIKDGRIVRVEGGLEAMKQAVSIILQTERFGYQIYSSDFGIELRGLIGKPEEYVTSMIKRRVAEALKVDKRIRSVKNYTFHTDGKGGLYCVFEVNTVYGSFQAEVGI